MLLFVGNMFIVSTIFSILLICETKADSESTHSSHSYTKDEPKDDRKRSSASDYWRNHNNYVNYLYAKNRESKSNNEPYFSEPNNNNDGYESMPSTIQITALPAGGFGGAGAAATGFPGFGGFGGGFGGFGGGFGGLGPTDAFGQPIPFTQQKFPVFVINKSKSDSIKWLLPLLLILGLPLLCGVILIPIALQSIFFIMTIIRNLGILLPLIPAITGNPANPIIPTTG